MVCSQCNSPERYYAKGLCSNCYQRGSRLKHLEARQAYDRVRQKTEHRRSQDRSRNARHKEARNLRCREYRLKHLEAIREYDRIRSKSQERKANCARLLEKNRDRVRALDRARYRRDPVKRIELVERRRKHKGIQTPKWLTPEHKEQLRQIYKNRPEGHHVDHIIPLQGKNVSGLHVPWNLQYLPAQQNLRKGNKVV